MHTVMSGCASCGPFCVGIFYILGLLLTVSRLASSVARSMPRGTAAHGFTTRELLSDLSIVEGEPRHRQTTGTLLGTHALLTRSSFGRTPHNNTEDISKCA